MILTLTFASQSPDEFIDFEELSPNWKPGWLPPSKIKSCAIADFMALIKGNTPPYSTLYYSKFIRRCDSVTWDPANDKPVIAAGREQCIGVIQVVCITNVTGDKLGETLKIAKTDGDIHHVFMVGNSGSCTNQHNTTNN